MDTAQLTAGAFDPTKVTRILFEGFSLPAITLFYLAGFAAIAVFLHGCWVEIRKYRRGSADPASATLLWQRFKAMAGLVLSHRTIARRDKAAGHAHRLIFFGFAVLFIGTATSRSTTTSPASCSAGTSGTATSTSGSRCSATSPGWR